MQGLEPISKQAAAGFVRRKANTKLSSPRIVTVMQTRQKKTSVNKMANLEKGVLIKNKSNTRS